MAFSQKLRNRFSYKNERYFLSNLSVFFAINILQIFNVQKLV